MHPCTDVCTYSNQDVGPEVALLDTDTVSHRGTHVFHVAMQGSGADMGSQVYMHKCTDACTHST